MSQEGIITENHNKYIQIMNKHDRVNVYYQVIGELTHIKLYSFSKEEVFKTLWVLQILLRMVLFIIMNYYVNLTIV